MSKRHDKNNPSPHSSWVDISVPLTNDIPTWPGDPEVKITSLNSINIGDEDNLTHISMCAHTGTHVDAPYHFIKSGKTIDQMPISAGVGKARVIEIKNKELINVEEIRPHKIRKGDRLLFKTGNSKKRWHNKPFMKDFVHLSADAAQYLAERKIQTVGVDYLSIGGFEGNVEQVHKIILGAGIWVIEGLDLSKVVPGNYDLRCLPINIKGSDGAPARAIIRAL